MVGVGEMSGSIIQSSLTYGRTSGIQAAERQATIKRKKKVHH